MSKEGVLKRLSNYYFQGVADNIANAKQISGMFPNSSDVGDIRENILKSFLMAHLPTRCSIVKGGFVFSANGEESKQIDIIVTHDAALQFAYFDRGDSQNKRIQTVEGCLAAISVKSDLEGKLEEVLENLASIPKMPKSVLKGISPLVSNPELYLLFPKKIIFAFSGNSAQTTLNRINDFYRQRPFEDHQKADLIIVNNSFSVLKVGPLGTNTRDGKGVLPGEYYPEYKGDPTKTGDGFGALPLLRLLTTIQTATQWIPNVLFDYNDYINAMDFHGD